VPTTTQPKIVSQNVPKQKDTFKPYNLVIACVRLKFKEILKINDSLQELQDLLFKSN
jgi:hypothetical protein